MCSSDLEGKKRRRAVYTKGKDGKVFRRTEEKAAMDLSGLPLYVINLSGSRKNSHSFARILDDQGHETSVEIIY